MKYTLSILIAAALACLWTLTADAQFLRFSRRPIHLTEVRPFTNNPPTAFVIDAGTAKSITISPLTLEGSSDGCTGTPAFVWAVLDGDPGEVHFDDPTATNAVATFDSFGSYTLGLAGLCGSVSRIDTVRIDYFATTVTNQPPVFTGITNIALIVGTGAYDMFFTLTDDRTASSAIVTSIGQTLNHLSVANVAYDVGNSWRVRVQDNTTLGTTVLTLIATDGDGSKTTNTSTVVTSPAPAPPAFHSLIGGTTNEDSTLTITGATVTDADTSLNLLTFQVITTNPQILPPNGIAYTFNTNTGALDFTFTPNANKFGDVIVSVTVRDNQGHSTAGNIHAIWASVDDPPTQFVSAVFQIPLGRSGTEVISVADIDTAIALVTTTATSDNQSVIPNSQLTVTGTGTNRTINIAPLAAGTAVITFHTCDDAPLCVDSTTTVNAIAAPSTPPTISDPGAQSVNEDDQKLVSYTIADAETATNNLVMHSYSSDQTLVQDSGLAFTGSTGTRTLTITPVGDAHGVLSITNVVVDTSGLSATNVFALTIVSLNDCPVSPQIAAQSTPEDMPKAVSISVSDVDGDTLTLSATSSNTGLVPNDVGHITFSGSGNNRTLTLTTVLNQTGATTIDTSIFDGTCTIHNIFVLTVAPLPDPPTINSPSNQTIVEDSATNIVFTVTDPDTALASLTMSSISSNPVLFPAGSLVWSGTTGTRTLTATPAANQNGTATITSTVSDGTSSVSSSLTITVTAQNDAPTIAPVANQTLIQGSNTLSIVVTVNDIDSTISTLTLSATSSATSVLPLSGITFSGTTTSRTVTFTPSTSGVSTVTLTVSDGSLTATTASFTVTKPAAINNPPTISTIAPQTIIAGASGFGRSFFVDPATGSDSNNGTSTGTAWAHVPGAVGFSGSGWVNFIDGDVIVVKGGSANNYQVKLLASRFGGSQAFDRVTILSGDLFVPAWGSGAAIFDEQSTRTYGFFLSGSHGVSIDGVEVKNIAAGGVDAAFDPTDGSSCIVVGGNAVANYVTIRRCYLHDALRNADDRGHGIETSGGSHLRVTYCTIGPNIGTKGIEFQHTDFSEADHNFVTGTADHGIVITSDKCDIHDNIVDMKSPWNQQPVYACKVNNHFNDLWNNLFFISNRNAEGAQGYGVHGSTNRFVHNTVYGLGDTGNGGQYGVAASIGFEFVACAANEVQNNLFFRCNNVLGNIQYFQYDGLSATVTRFNDLWYTNLTESVITVGHSGVYNQYSVAAYEALSLGSGNTKSGNQQLNPFVKFGSLPTGFINNYPNTDAFLLTGSTPALVRATGNSLSGDSLHGLSSATSKFLKDIQGTARASISMGAYEFGSVPVVPAATSPSLVVAFTVGDAETPAGSLTISQVSSNPALLPTANMVNGGSGANRTLTVTPATGQRGTVTVTLTVHDAGALTASSSFVLTVTSLSPPVFGAAIPAKSLGVGSVLAVATSVSDAETAAGLLTLATSSANASVATISTATNTGGAVSFTLTGVSVGSTTASVVVTDTDGLKATNTFSITVTSPINTPPTISGLANHSIVQGGTDNQSFSVADAESGAAAVTLTVLSDNTALVPIANVVFGGSGSSRTAVITPIPSASGTVTITIVAHDPQGLTATQSFTLSVSATGGRTFFVAPNGVGSSSNSGLTQSAPWNIGSVQARGTKSLVNGDTLIYLPGLYVGRYVYTGYNSSQVIIHKALNRNWGNNTALFSTFDRQEPTVGNGSIDVEIGGVNNIRFEGFEFINTALRHHFPDGNTDRGDAFYVTGRGNIQIVNNNIKDSGNGIGFEDDPSIPTGSPIIAGNVTAYNGVCGTDDCQHGHGLYIQTKDPAHQAIFRDNVSHNNMGQGTQTRGGDEALIFYNLIEMFNVYFNNGFPGGSRSRNFFHGGGERATNYVFRTNYMYYAGPDGGPQAFANTFYTDSGHVGSGPNYLTNLIVQGNTILNGGLTFGRWELAHILQNRIQSTDQQPGFVWQNQFGTLGDYLGSNLMYGVNNYTLDGSSVTKAAFTSASGGANFASSDSQVGGTMPAFVDVLVNPYDSKMANVVVWNPSGASTVTFSVGSFLAVGDTYDVFSTTNWRQRFSNGQFPGTITVNMFGFTLMQMVGFDGAPGFAGSPQSPEPYFACFRLIKTN